MFICQSCYRPSLRGEPVLEVIKIARARRYWPRRNNEALPNFSSIGWEIVEVRKFARSHKHEVKLDPRVGLVTDDFVVLAGGGEGDEKVSL